MWSVCLESICELVIIMDYWLLNSSYNFQWIMNLSTNHQTIIHSQQFIIKSHHHNKHTKWTQFYNSDTPLHPAPLAACTHYTHYDQQPPFSPTSSSPSSLSDDASSSLSLASHASLASRQTHTNDTSPQSKTNLATNQFTHMFLETEYAPNQQAFSRQHQTIRHQPHRSPHHHLRLRHVLRHCRNCRNHSTTSRRRRQQNVTVLRRHRNARYDNAENSRQHRHQVESNTT